MARLNSMPQMNLRMQQVIDDHVIALAWSTDSAYLAAAAVSGPIVLLDVAQQTCTHTLAGHSFGTTGIAWHPKKPLLASVGQDGQVRLWNTKTGEQVAQMAGGAAWVEHLAWSPSGNYLATAAGKRLKLWNPDGSLVQEYPLQSSTISGIEWSSKGKEFAISGYGKVVFYKPTEATAYREFAWQGSILGLTWSPDMKMLAGGGQDATVHFWFVKDGDDLQMSGYPMKITSVSFDATSRYLATNGGEIPIVWDCSGDGPAGSKPLMFERHEQPVTQVRFQHRGVLLASGCEAGVVAIWYPGGSKKVLAEADIGQGIASLAWSPGDGRLAVGGQQGFVAIYSV